MAVWKANFGGQQFVGLFAKACDEYLLFAKSSGDKFEKCLRNLGVPMHRTSVALSPYAGVYFAANSNGIIAPPFLDEKELAQIKALGVNVHVLEDTRFCAAGNNIACNDRGAIINPDIPKAEAKRIEDALGVEVAEMQICGYKTAGMMVVATNKGWAANNRISEDEAKKMEEIFGSKGLNCTTNGGNPMVGLGIIANSKAAVAGEGTSGFELGRIEQALDLTA